VHLTLGIVHNKAGGIKLKYTEDISYHVLLQY